MTLDNALVKQKNEILNCLRNGKIEQALQFIQLVWPVWDCCEYSYKTDEILIAAQVAITAYATAFYQHDCADQWENTLRNIYSERNRQ
jgi:hypothetical protein